MILGKLDANWFISNRIEGKIDCWEIEHKGAWLYPISSKGSFICTIPQAGRKEMFYLTTHSTHFIYGYMASDIW